MNPAFLIFFFFGATQAAIVAVPFTFGHRAGDDTIVSG